MYPICGVCGGGLASSMPYIPYGRRKVTIMGKNKNAVVAVAASSLNVEPQAELTEVDPSKGLTPEQLAVANSLPTTIEGSPDTRKERHPDRLKKSSIQGPTKLVWNIANQMMNENPATTRKQILEKCQELGIAFYTARTQYQAWKKAKEAKPVEQLEQKSA